MLLEQSSAEGARSHHRDEKYRTVLRMDLDDGRSLAVVRKARKRRLRLTSVGHCGGTFEPTT